MTNEEKTRITGQVVIELAEAKRTLACLEAKAERMSLEFGLLANWLRGHFPSGAALDSALSVPDALKLVEEIKDTKASVEQPGRTSHAVGGLA